MRRNSTNPASFPKLVGGPNTYGGQSDLIWVADLLVPKSRTPVRIVLQEDYRGGLRALLRRKNPATGLEHAHIYAISTDEQRHYGTGYFGAFLDNDPERAIRQHMSPGINNTQDLSTGLGATLYYGGAIASALVEGPGETFSASTEGNDDLSEYQGGRSSPADAMWDRLVKLGIAIRDEIEGYDYDRDPVTETVTIYPDHQTVADILGVAAHDIVTVEAFEVEIPGDEDQETTSDTHIDYLPIRRVLTTGFVLAVNTALIDLAGIPLVQPAIHRVAQLDLSHTPVTTILYWLRFLAGTDPFSREPLQFADPFSREPLQADPKEYLQVLLQAVQAEALPKDKTVWEAVFASMNMLYLPGFKPRTYKRTPFSQLKKTQISHLTHRTARQRVYESPIETVITAAHSLPIEELEEANVTYNHEDQGVFLLEDHPDMPIVLPTQHRWGQLHAPNQLHALYTSKGTFVDSNLQNSMWLGTYDTVNITSFQNCDLRGAIFFRIHVLGSIQGSLWGPREDPPQDYAQHPGWDNEVYTLLKEIYDGQSLRLYLGNDLSRLTAIQALIASKPPQTMVRGVPHWVRSQFILTRFSYEALQGSPLEPYTEFLTGQEPYPQPYPQPLAPEDEA